MDSNTPGAWKTPQSCLPAINAVGTRMVRRSFESTPLMRARYQFSPALKASPLKFARVDSKLCVRQPPTRLLGHFGRNRFGHRFSGFHDVVRGKRTQVHVPSTGAID